MRSWQVNVSLLEIFGQLAVILCAIGVYAVAAYSAGTRRRELAIRTAFGATRRELIALVLRDELRAVLVGVAFGLGGAALVAPRLGVMLFATDPFDRTIYVAVAAGLLGIAALASYLPAWRAGQSDPADLLRA